jgi:hypothetical protein
VEHKKIINIILRECSPVKMFLAPNTLSMHGMALQATDGGSQGRAMASSHHKAGPLTGYF